MTLNGISVPFQVTQARSIWMVGVGHVATRGGS
jgi:hypothetical protein